MMRPRALVLAMLLCLAAAARAQEQPLRGDGGLHVVGLSFVAILVEDVAEAADWYRTMLGLTEVNRLEADDGRYSIRLLSGSGLTVELIRRRDVAPRLDKPHLGFFKAGFYVENIESALAWLRGRGVDTDDSIFVDEALDASSFVFRDPDGNRLQVFQQRGPA